MVHLSDSKNMIEDSDELWNSWSSNSSAAIILDGKKLNDVFSAIRSQLDFLRRQHRATDEKFENYYHIHQNQTVQHAHEPVYALKHDLMATQPIAKPTVAPAPAPPVEQVLDAEELQIILDRIHALETDVRKHDHFGDRLDKLEAHVNQRLSGMQSHIDRLTARVEANSAMESLFDMKFERLESSFNERIEQLTQGFEQKLSHAKHLSQEELLSQLSTVNALRGVVEINELRLKKAESELAKSCEIVREVQETIDYFPVKYLDNIRNDILELYMVKAGKDELANKADEALTQSKADQTEVVRLEQHAIDLTRRMDLHSKEMHDGFAQVDTKLDKRIDKVAQWVLKHLRREMKAQNFGQDEPRDGTDIGRVKCLVCDQVVNQQRETEIVHSGPGLKNVIKPHHIPQPHPNQQQQQSLPYNQHYPRPRSASPPPSRGRGYGTGPSPAMAVGPAGPETSSNKASTKTAPGTLPLLNQAKQPANTHSKLVKLGAQPIGAVENLGTGAPAAEGTITSATGVEYTDDVEPAEEFNYRVETDVGTPSKDANPSSGSPVNVHVNANGHVTQVDTHNYGPRDGVMTPARLAAQEDGPLRLAHAAHLHSHQKESATHIATSASQPILQQKLELNVQQENANYFRDLEE